MCIIQMSRYLITVQFYLWHEIHKGLVNWDFFIPLTRIYFLFSSHLTYASEDPLSSTSRFSLSKERCNAYVRSTRLACLNFWDVHVIHPLCTLICMRDRTNTTVNVNHLFNYSNMCDWDAGDVWFLGNKSLQFEFLGVGNLKRVKR